MCDLRGSQINSVTGGAKGLLDGCSTILGGVGERERGTPSGFPCPALSAANGRRPSAAPPAPPAPRSPSPTRPSGGQICTDFTFTRGHVPMPPTKTDDTSEIIAKSVMQVACE